MKSIRTTSYRASLYSTVPFIRISGEWLNRLGFNIGSTFTLKIDKLNKHIILELNQRSNNE